MNFATESENNAEFREKKYLMFASSSKFRINLFCEKMLSSPIHIQQTECQTIFPIRSKVETLAGTLMSKHSHIMQFN